MQFHKIESRFPDFGVNKKQELTRLVYEISKREKIPPEKVLNSILPDNFEAVKKELLKRRFPYASARDEEIKPYLPKFTLDPALSFNMNNSRFNPKKILIEKPAINSCLAKRFKAFFPKAEFTEILSLKSFIKDNKKSGIANPLGKALR